MGTGKNSDPIVPVLHALFSSDLLDAEGLAGDMRTCTPGDPEDFYLRVQAFIGSGESPPGDSFDFVFTTPNALARRVGQNGFVFGQPYFVVRRYDYDLLEAE